MAFIPAQRPIVAKGTSRDLTDILVAESVAFVPAIAAVAAVVVVIKEVHIAIQTVENYAQLWTTALRSAELACVRSVIKQIVPISLTVIAL